MPGARNAVLARTLRLSAFAGVWSAAVLLELPLCPAAVLARLPCPGCGITRSALALMRLDLKQAMRLNPLSPIVVPASALLAAYSAYHYVRHGRTRLGERVPSAIGIAIALGLGVVWSLRFLGFFGGPIDV